jgi:hypothetical protein
MSLSLEEHTMPKHIVTKELLTHMINNGPRQTEVIGRALVVLFNNQTTTEQASNDTIEHNMVGFTGADARRGSITAKYFLRHNNLQDWQIEYWTRPNSKGTPRLAKYWRQLDKAAQAKKGVAA